MHNNYDVLIIGGGAAGLSAAIHLAKHAKVCLLFKTDEPAGASYWAQGGIAVPLKPNDSIESHVQDTLQAGAGLCNEESVRFVVENAREQLDWLLEQGVQLSKDSNQELHLTKEGGHSQHRIVHANDATGAAIQECLRSNVINNPNIDMHCNYIAIDLITQNSIYNTKECYGVFAFNQTTEQIEIFSAKATILATGGASRVYLYSTNPEVASGDGIAMGWRAGAIVSNMEFNQFHPTCLYNLQSRTFLLTEALRGEGAKLKLPANSGAESGKSFMHNYHPLAELASRDIVARAIDAEMKKHSLDYVHLDISHQDASFITSHFPTIYNHCLKIGIDLTRQPAPIVPAAHYTCGGLQTDLNGKTNINNLYAIGEVAHTGLHGANRIASNSLLECLVFSASASFNIIKNILPNPNQKIPLQAYNQIALFSLHKNPSTDTLLTIAHNWDSLRRTMWDYVGIVRNHNRLLKAKKRVELLHEETEELFNSVPLFKDLLELRNLIEVSKLIINSALSRKESRGLHYSLDYPKLLPKAVDTVFINHSHIKNYI